MNDFNLMLEKYFSKNDLKKIQTKTIGIAGLGGLGSNCAHYLVRSGFINFVLCDFDKVEPSNLNRQFYFYEQIGIQKTEALKTNLLRINGGLNLKLFSYKISETNAGEIFKDCDAVVEACDTVEAKKMLAESFSRSGKLFVSASGLAGCGNSDNIKVNKIHDNFFIVGDALSEASQNNPPLAPRVNIAAAKQADIVLAWVLDILTTNML